MDNKMEETDILQILRQFAIYRSSLSKEHEDFVRKQIQKEYEFVTKTYELQGRVYKGTYRTDSKRCENIEAYKKESKLATVLASFGFDVILIEENNSIPGKKPDAIVNGVVMDFKEIEALDEQSVGKNTFGKNYQEAMRKENSAGVAMYIHNFSENFVYKNMIKKTSPTRNGMALFFHEDTGNLQLIDMENVRASHYRKIQIITSSVSSEKHIKDITSIIDKRSSVKKRMKNDIER